MAETQGQMAVWVEPGSPVARYRDVVNTGNFQMQVLGALPQDVDRQRYAALLFDHLAHFVSALPAGDQKLVLGNPALLTSAMRQTAARGLVPGRGSKEVAWILRKGYTRQDGTRTPDSIDVDAQWQGLVRLMRRNPDVLDVAAHLVHPRDVFVWREMEQRVEVHEADPLDPERRFLHPDDPEAKGIDGLRGGWGRVQFRDGRVVDWLVTAAEVHARRKRSDNPGVKDRGGRKSTGPWYNDFAAMCRKTVLRIGADRRVVDWTELSEVFDDADRIDGYDPQAQVRPVQTRPHVALPPPALQVAAAPMPAETPAPAQEAAETPACTDCGLVGEVDGNGRCEGCHAVHEREAQAA